MFTLPDMPSVSALGALSHSSGNERCSLQYLRPLKLSDLLQRTLVLVGANAIKVQGVRATRLFGEIREDIVLHAP